MAARTIVCGNLPGISTYPAILNPSFAIGIQISSWFNDLGEALKWIWLYPVMPFAGAILAIVFFEFVYRKTQTIIQHNRNDEGEKNSSVKVEFNDHKSDSSDDGKKDSLLHNDQSVHIV